MRGTIEQRFWAKVDKSGDCWLWTASRNTQRHGQGYGVMKAGDRIVLAHRFSYELHVGPIPSGMSICHVCDNPPCVNPAHLWLGSDADNARDMIAKGRKAIIDADTFCLTKVTNAQVEEIRALWATGEYYQYEIAAMYGIVRTHVCNIVNNKARR